MEITECCSGRRDSILLIFSVLVSDTLNYPWLWQTGYIQTTLNLQSFFYELLSPCFDLWSKHDIFVSKPITNLSESKYIR